jgi:sporulation protein YlmC with PRC-barrel domain
MEHVVSFGKDAMIITDSKAVVRVDHFPEVKAIMEDRDGLVGKQVFTESGDMKGKVEDIFFDEATGNIVGLEVEGKFTPKNSNASVQLRPSDIVSIGPDAVVINMASVPMLAAQGAGGPKPLDAPVGTTGDAPPVAATDAPMSTLADVPAATSAISTDDSTGEYARLSGSAPADQIATSDASMPATSSDATVQLPSEPDQGRDN